MKTLKAVAFFLAIFCLAGIAQAPNQYSLGNNGITFTQGTPLTALATFGPQISYLAQQKTSDPSQGWNLTGFSPTTFFAQGRDGVTQNVPFLKPDGSTGIMEIAGGIIVYVQ